MYMILNHHFPLNTTKKEVNKIKRLNPSQGVPIITPAVSLIPMWSVYMGFGVDKNGVN